MRAGVNAFNAGVMKLADAPLVGSRIRSVITEISYTGRKSGKRFTLPVGYRRVGNVVTIAVGMPDHKQWWRNFLGDGAPLTIELDGAERTGHAVARRDDKGGVSVTLTLVD